MGHLIFLGTAAAVASKERDNTSLLFISNEEKILIDVPGSIVKKLKTIAVDFKSISRVFLTHSHPDHIYGIVALLHSQYRLKNTVHIYAHPKTIKTVKILRKIFSIEDTSRYPKLRYHKIRTGQFFESPNFKVSAFKVKHQPESIGFRLLFKKSRRVCVFSGDASSRSNLISKFKEADFLIHDCFSTEKIFKKYPILNKMHTSSLALGKIAQRSKVGTLIPIHFAGEVKYSMKEIKKEIKKNFTGRIIIPQDLEGLSL